MFTHSLLSPVHRRLPDQRVVAELHLVGMHHVPAVHENNTHVVLLHKSYHVTCRRTLQVQLLHPHHLKPSEESWSFCLSALTSRWSCDPAWWRQWSESVAERQPPATASCLCTEHTRRRHRCRRPLSQTNTQTHQTQTYTHTGIVFLQWTSV